MARSEPECTEYETMAGMHYVERNNFHYGFDHFTAEYKSPRVDVAHLKAMFLRRPVSPEGKNMLLKHYLFVLNQLQHYDIDYDLDDYSGNGVNLLKSVLRAGLCDEVPEHLVALEAQMHTEWMEKVTLEQLIGAPEFLMEKFFVDRSGVPVQTKRQRFSRFPIAPAQRA